MVESEPRPVPKAPRGLAAAGRRAWRLVMMEMPLAAPMDSLTVERFARLVDERATVAVEMDRGVLLTEPIVSPKGEVVGERQIANPAASMLRAIDRELDQLVDRLALVPAARARLGLTVSLAERQRAEVERVLDTKWRPNDPRGME